MSEFIVMLTKPYETNFGPGTCFYAFASVEGVMDRFPDAILRGELEEGDSIDKPIIIQPEDIEKKPPLWPFYPDSEAEQ